MQIEQSKLIDDLLAVIARAVEAANKFKLLTDSQLNFKEIPSKWSILECLEHLNLYGDFYLPEIEKVLLANNHKMEGAVFKSGLLGNYFVNLMNAKKGVIKKMKTPKDKNPLNYTLSNTTIDRFLKQLERLKNLLLLSGKTDLTKLKTRISLTKFIKLRLGDTLRFVIYHIERHILQAENIAVK